jgi:hypothetical protein
MASVRPAGAPKVLARDYLDAARCSGHRTALPRI